MNVPTTGEYAIVLEGIVGSGRESSVVAVDDVSIVDGICPEVKQSSISYLLQ